MGLPCPERQTLLLDADDTLWENSIFFERAIAAFISFLDHASHTPAEVRDHLNRVELRTIAERGYGTESFRLSLVRCFEELSHAPPTAAQHASILCFVDAIATAKIEVIEGVREALERLGQEHRLILVTKGNRLEQVDKLERSGLAPFFTDVEVLAEKTVYAYDEIRRRHGCDARRTWMIGNSPRSDINPALAAGLHAVFIPHSDTWMLEEESLRDPLPGRYLLRLDRLHDVPERLQSLLGLGQQEAASARTGMLYSTSD